MDIFEDEVVCAECRGQLSGTLRAEVVQQPVFDFDGTVDYVELAHRGCMPEWSKWDDWNGGDKWS